ncbi:MAG: hypothetical protein RR636_12215 [Clostridium sp.]|uniref:hypothetical protein n=1 Tax=Clostridium sp. TaxID=1506 RepID=UPI003074B062
MIIREGDIVMCGCGNTGNMGCSGFGFQPCTILLIIVILKNQCLLDTECNPGAKNALTLIFLYWLCGMNRSGSNSCGNMGCGSNNMMCGCGSNSCGCCQRRICCNNRCC